MKDFDMEGIQFSIFKPYLGHINRKTVSRAPVFQLEFIQLPSKKDCIVSYCAPECEKKLLKDKKNHFTVFLEILKEGIKGFTCGSLSSFMLSFIHSFGLALGII